MTTCEVPLEKMLCLSPCVNNEAILHLNSLSIPMPRSSVSYVCECEEIMEKIVNVLSSSIASVLITDAFTENASVSLQTRFKYAEHALFKKNTDFWRVV